MVDIVPCGQFARRRQRGVPRPRANASLIASPWREAVADLADQLAGVAGACGLFVRGSVATGAAVPGIADFDYIVLLDQLVDEDLLDELDADLSRRHPGIGKVDRFDTQWPGNASQFKPWTAFILRARARGSAGSTFSISFRASPRGSRPD